MKSRFLILSLLLFALATVPAAAGSGGFKEPQKYLFPKDLNTFFVAPDQPAVIELQLKGMPENSSLRYEMSDYAGKVFRKGSAMAEKGELRLRESFPRGLTDLSFPELNQRIGVYAFDAFDKVEDGYWGVNSVFSSMVYSRPGQPRYRNGIFAKPETIRQHMRLLRRLGIGQLREMDTLWKQAPAPGKFLYNVDLAQETQNAARENGLHILMYYAHFPGWCGAEGIFSRKQPQVLPLDYARFTPILRKMLQLDAVQASGAQAGNEWDMERVAAPPDAISLLGHYMRYLLDSSSLSTPLVGMAFSGFAESCIVRPEYLQSFFENGYFDSIDIFGVNGYAEPPEMRRRLDLLTSDLERFSSGSVPPLWITESGKAWYHGGLRPVVAEDLACADASVRKAIDARAMGVEKFFQFQLHFSPEDYNFNQVFSLLDWSLSPQRTLAAYATAVRMLSNLRYTGTLTEKIPGCEEALLFENGGRRILVIYRDPAGVGKPLPLRTVPVKAVFQMDGAERKPDADGAYAFTGNILYAELQPGVSLPVDSQNVLTRIRDRFRANRRQRPAARPVLLRTEFEKMERMRSGYIVRAREFELVVRAFNLSDTPQTIRLNVSGEGILTETPSQGAETLPPMQGKVFRWKLSCPEKNFTPIRVGGSLNQAHPLVMRFYFPPRLDQPRLAITPRAAEWKPWSSGTLKISDDPQENAMRIDASFQVLDRWLYPRYRLKLPAESLKDCYAMTYEARTDKASAEAGYKYYGAYLITDRKEKVFSGRSFDTLDSNWKTFTVFLNENLGDSASIREIEIGSCPQTPKSTLWIRNIRFY